MPLGYATGNVGAPNPWTSLGNWVKHVYDIKKQQADYVSSLTPEQYAQQQVVPGYDYGRAQQEANAYDQQYATQMASYNQAVAQQNAEYDRAMQDYNNQLVAYNSQVAGAQAAEQKAQQDWQQSQLVGSASAQAGGGGSSGFGGVSDARPDQLVSPYVSAVNPFGITLSPQLPPAAVSAPQSGRQGYQRATVGGGAFATPGNVISGPTFKPKNKIEELIGAPYTGVRTPVSKAWQNIVGEAGAQATRENMDLAAGRKPLTNMLGWDKNRPPDTLTPKGIGLKPEGYGNTLRATSKEQLIANGVVVVDAQGRQFFNQGAYRGLPAERWTGDAAWIANQVATGKWSLAWANEYARLIGLNENIGKAATQQRTTALNYAAQQAAVTAPRTTSSGYGSSGYGSSGYGSSGYGSGVTTPDTSNLPGWLQAWQKMRI